MSAYDSMRLDDLLQRKARDETLTTAELATMDRLCRQDQADADARPTPFMYGGDMVDVF